MPAGASKPLRLLIVLPSWVGDAVMATPALGLVRAALPGAFIGALVRPGIDQVLEGTPFFDHVHVEHARGVMGPKSVAARLRPLRYDTALLLTNSFSTALITRLAWIPRRVGYDRDARGLLLTDRLRPVRTADGRGFAPVPAVEYYLAAARALVGEAAGRVDPPLLLATTAADERAAEEILARAAPPLLRSRPLVVLNPGGNNPAKRWPAERFAEVGTHLIRQRGVNILVNGSPAEADLANEVVMAIRRQLADAGAPAAALPGLGITIGSLKAVVRCAALMITNDTGPRHIAAAFNVPTVTLFGPTDPRWTTLPTGPGRARSVEVVADPMLPPDQVADEHVERCRIDRISVERVIEAVESVIDPERAAAGGAGTTPPASDPPAASTRPHR